MGYYKDEEVMMSKGDKMKAGIKSFMWRRVVPISILAVSVIALPMAFGINDAGERTVIQTISGQMKVKFSSGPYFTGFGKTWEYNDFATFDFDRSVAKGEATLDQSGITVRYQDGGEGTIYGKSRYALPTDEDTMLKLHKAFKSKKGFANKLIKPVTEQGMNLTAGLMKSEEAYATKRAIFTQMAKAQIGKGIYETKLESVRVTDEVTGRFVVTQVPVVALDKNNQPIHLSSDLAEYGVSVVGFQLNDPGFEQSTMAQIAKKRAATMDIITAKANAEKAKQTAITAEEDGKAAVMKARYEEEVLKQKAIVAAQREKEVATINAERRVEVAAQAKLEAEQKKFSATEYKQEQILIGEGEAERKCLTMEADGALEQKLRAYVEVNKNFAREFGKQKWVPEINMGGSTGTAGSEATDMIKMLMVKTAKDLNLDMSTKVQQ